MAAQWTDDPRVFAWARHAEGELDAVPLARLAEQARTDLGPEAGRAALMLARVWRKQREKFPTWHEFCADTIAAEQASGERAALWRAVRFAGCARVLDLACGAGGDTIALSRVAAAVVAVDRDIERLRWARCNVRRYGRPERVRFLCADVAGTLPDADAAVLDPDRRSLPGARAVRPAGYSPPPEVWERIRLRVGNLAVKVAPGIPYEDIPSAARAEFIEDRGECREAVLWFGDLGPRARTATVLPASLTAASPGPPMAAAPPMAATINETEVEGAAIGPVDAFIYDPGPAAVRAHLVRQLASRLDAHRLDAEVAYLSGPRGATTPFAATFAVEEVWPFHLGRLRALLRERGIGALEIRARRFPIRPDDLRRMLHLAGEREATLVCTRIADAPTVILCRRVREDG